MSCKSCKYFNEDDAWKGKGYCEYMKSYYWPEDKACSHYINRDRSSCFLTSACCQYRGLPDDCAELTTLRNFRDTVMLPTEEGAKLIEEYYRIAPGIVEKINTSNDRDSIYQDIYSVIRKCVSLIEQQEHHSALCEYKAMVLRLQALEI